MGKWTKEPWRVILGGRGGTSPEHWGLCGMDDDLIFANGDPNHLQRSKECVNAMKDIPDPARFVATAAENERLLKIYKWAFETLDYHIHSWKLDDETGWNAEARHHVALMRRKVAATHQALAAKEATE